MENLGFIIEGLDYNEMVDTDIADVLTKATDILPEDKPRLLFGPRTPGKWYENVGRSLCHLLAHCRRSDTQCSRKWSRPV